MRYVFILCIALICKIGSSQDESGINKMKEKIYSLIKEHDTNNNMTILFDEHSFSRINNVIKNESIKFSYVGNRTFRFYIYSIESNATVELYCENRTKKCLSMKDESNSDNLVSFFDYNFKNADEFRIDYLIPEGDKGWSVVVMTIFPINKRRLVHDTKGLQKRLE